jgi:hypothetical protein
LSFVPSSSVRSTRSLPPDLQTLGAIISLTNANKPHDLYTVIDYYAVCLRNS